MDQIQGVWRYKETKFQLQYDGYNAYGYLLSLPQMDGTLCLCLEWNMWTKSKECGDKRRRSSSYNMTGTVPTATCSLSLKWTVLCVYVWNGICGPNPRSVAIKGDEVPATI